MVDLALLHGIAQGPHDMLLAYDVRERARAVAAVQRWAGGHGRPSVEGSAAALICCVRGARCSGLAGTLGGCARLSLKYVMAIAPTPLVERWQRVADRQWGVVSRRQLAAPGSRAAPCDIGLAAGRLHGCTAASTRSATACCARRATAWRRCWRAGPARCSATAARPHTGGCCGTDQTRIDVTAPAARHGIPGIRLHRSRSLDAQDTTHHEGIPITTVARTLLDLAATARRERARARARAGERLRALRPPRDHRRHRPSQRAPRNTASSRGPTSREPKWTQNEWEAAVPGLVRDAGLPEPETQRAFHAPDHGHCEPDYHWPQHRVIVETDGFETHGTRQAFRNDRAKDAALTARRLPRPQIHSRRRARPRAQAPTRSARATQRRLGLGQVALARAPPRPSCSAPDRGP